MKRTVFVTILAAAATCAVAGDENLDEHLYAFEPLLASRWVGAYSPDSEGLTHIMSIEAILSGQVIRLSKDVPEIGYSSETSIFWNPATENVELVSLTNKGHVLRGTVSVSGGAIELLMWRAGNPDGERTRLVFTIGEGGALSDEFFRQTTDGWRRGHLVIYDREKPVP